MFTVLVVALAAITIAAIVVNLIADYVAPASSAEFQRRLSFIAVGSGVLLLATVAAMGVDATVSAL